MGLYARSLSLLLFALIAASVVSASSTRSLRLGLLAVDLERDHGMVIPATLFLEPGSGDVDVLPRGAVDDSTYYSTLLASRLALLFAGHNPLRYRVVLVVNTSTPVGGPSAGGFIASALYDLALGLVPETTNTTMTGMLSLTGAVLPVSGIPEKLEAARENGYARIILPRAEAREYAAKGAGPGVAGVCDVLGASDLLSAPVSGRPGSLVAASSSTIRHPDAFRRDALKLIGYAESLAPALPPGEREKVSAMEAAVEEALERGDYYSAASLAFVALYRAAHMFAAKKSFGELEERLGLKLEDEIKRAEEAVKRVDYKAGGGLCYYWRFAGLSEASYRLYLAKQVKGMDNVLSLLRALSARTWADASLETSGPLVPCEEIRGLVGFMTEYAELSYKYLKSVLELPVIRVEIDNRSLAAWIGDMERAYAAGNLPLAMGLAAFTVSYMESRLLAAVMLEDCIIGHWNRMASLLGSWALFPSILYHGYASTYSGLVANYTGGSRIGLLASLEASATTWLLSGLALKALGGGEEKGQLKALLQPEEAYALLAAEAALLAIVYVTVLRLAKKV